LYLYAHREVSLNDRNELLQYLFLVKGDFLIQGILPDDLELLLDKSTKLQGFGLFLFVLDFDLISPICPDS
jgi:hypothetical protein